MEIKINHRGYPMQYTSEYGRKLKERDFAGVAEIVAHDFGVVVDPVALAEVCKPHQDFTDSILGEEIRQSQSSWSDGSWRCWLKNRLYDLGLFPNGGKPPMTIRLPVELHTGFIWLIETPADLERLRRPDNTKERNRVARSKIFKTLQKVLCPIDTTAARVAPPPE